MLRKEEIMARVIKRDTLTAQNIRQKVSVSDIYSIFLRIKKSECAESTYELYKEIGQRHIIPKLTEATNDDMNAITDIVIRDILDDYEADHGSGGRNFLLRHLKSFVNWYWQEYEISSPNPMKKVKHKKTSAKPKEGITQEEVDLLLKTAKEHSVFPERDIAMLMILCDTGIRRASLAGMKMKDVNLNRCEMIVFEKDQQYHTKAFGNATCKAIKKYLLCLADVKPDDPFWLQMDGRALTHVGMRQVLLRLCREAGIQEHHFHDFRRYYGKSLYESTHDIYLVSRALDHKDIYVTKRYIAIDDREDVEAVRFHSPMDRKFRQTGIKVQR